MSIPGVINMHNVFHNPAPYNYASLFHNTLALAFLKRTTPVLFGLFSACFFLFYFFHHFTTSPALPPPPNPKPPLTIMITSL